MRFSTAIFAAVVLAIPAFSAPSSSTPRVVEKYAGETTGRYIVKLKDDISHASVLGAINGKVTHSWTLINGFAGEFRPEALDAMLSNTDVEYISEDGIANATAVQNNAPWGLGRLSSVERLPNQNPNALNFQYSYTFTGRGVDIYVVDTGVRITHSQFGGRARWGATFGQGLPNFDDHGHGTHCAGTAAGSQYGVAKEANIIAVKVLNSQNQGAWSDIISGMDFVAAQAAASRRPSIASMSLGGGATRAVDDAVNRLTARGVHAIVAAGNDNADAVNYSPARAPAAITVAATNIADTKAAISNWGNVIDILAPGENVISAWNTGDFAWNTLTGTSMATPHVSGLVAQLIQRDGNVSPAAMSNKLQAESVRGRIRGFPANTVNFLAHVLR